MGRERLNDERRLRAHRRRGDASAERNARADGDFEDRSDDNTHAARLDARTLRVTEAPGALAVGRVAAEAEMSTTNVYSRFGGKDVVVDELHYDGLAGLHTYVAKHSKTGNPIETFRAAGVAYRDFALDNRRYFSVMFPRAIPGYIVGGGTSRRPRRLRPARGPHRRTDRRRRGRQRQPVRSRRLASGDMSRPRRTRDQPRRARRHRLGDNPSRPDLNRDPRRCQHLRCGWNRPSADQPVRRRGGVGSRCDRRMKGRRGSMCSGDLDERRWPRSAVTVRPEVESVTVLASLDQCNRCQGSTVQLGERSPAVGCDVSGRGRRGRCGRPR